MTSVFPLHNRTTRRSALTIFHQKRKVNEMGYVIFSIDNWTDLHTKAKFFRHMDTLRSMGKLNGKLLSLIGSWEGQLEDSFLLDQEDFETHVRHSGFVEDQTAFVIVSEEKSMPVRLDSIWGSLKVGRMKAVTKKKALAQDGWTYRPDTNTYYIIEV